MHLVHFNIVPVMIKIPRMTCLRSYFVLPVRNTFELLKIRKQNIQMTFSNNTGARDDTVLEEKERIRLVRFEHFVRSFVFPFARRRVGLKPSALCASLSDDRRNDIDCSNRQIADVVRAELGSRLSKSLRDIFTNFLSFESDWLSVVESGGHRLDLNSLRRTMWEGSSNTTRRAECSLMYVHLAYMLNMSSYVTHLTSTTK